MGAMTIEQFLGHSTSAPRGAFLKKWKDRPDHAIRVWLHTQAGITSLWRHQIPRIQEMDNGEKKVWGGNYVCWEDEALLKKQNRFLDDGTRSVPPEVCPMCKFLEWMREQVLDEKISWVDEVFKFEGDDADEERILHAGGMLSMYGAKDLTDQQKKEIREAGISLKKSWMEKSIAGPNYLFVVVDNDAPREGVQVTIETSLLGDKVKRVIHDSLQSLGREEGDPSKNPYCIEWQYDEHAREFQKKYHALRKDKIQLTDEISELIVDTDPPDTSNITNRFNALELRESLEEHCLIDVPWDKFFPSEDEKTAPKEEKQETRKAASKPAKREEKVPEVRGKRDTDRAPSPPPEDEEMVECDKCDTPAPVSATKCPNPKCGVSFVDDEEEEEEEEEEEAPPPKPAMRKRGQPKPETKAAAPKGKPSAGTKQRSGDDTGAFDLPHDGDDIPF